MTFLLFGLKWILTVLAASAVAWTLIHILAILGIFLAVAYPILTYPPWRALYPASLKDRPFFPKNLKSALLTSLAILGFTAVSVGLVYGESRLLSSLGFPPTPKTVSFTIPDKRQYRLGEMIPLRIEITGTNMPINTVQADLGFPIERLEIVDISTAGSFANIFVQKELDNETGYGRISGGLPNPGFSDSRGLFATVYFRGKAPGVAKVSYLPTSLVLANDGRGTNVIKDLTSISYLILPEKISAEEEKMQKQLLTETSPVLGVSAENGPQMIFYDQTQVLGAAKQSPAVGSPSFLEKILGRVGEIDQFILGRIFGGRK